MARRVGDRLKVNLDVPNYLSTQGMTGSLDDHQLLQYLKIREALQYLLH